MAVKKYRSVEQMSGPPKFRPLDPKSLQIACELMELAFALRPWAFKPGVRKYRSLEEASQSRRDWEVAHVRRERLS
jgi:hypothetical protein